MAEEPKKAEMECSPEPPPPPPPPPAPATEATPLEAPKDLAEEKAAVLPPPPLEEKPEEECKALAIVESNAFLMLCPFLFSFLLSI